MDEADLPAHIQDQTRILLSDSFRPHNMFPYMYHPTYEHLPSPISILLGRVSSSMTSTEGSVKRGCSRR